MPQLKVQVQRSTLTGGAPVAWVRLEGFLDASTVLEFEKTLRLLHREGRGDVVLDFAGALYANSTAIGAVLNYRNLLLAEGRDLLIVSLNPQVRTIFEVLGLAHVVPCLPDDAAATAYLASAPPGQRDPGAFAPPAPASAAGRAAPSPAAAREAKRNVMMIAPEENRFTDIMKMRLLSPHGRFHIVMSCSEALHHFDLLDPDLIVLEDPMHGSEDFLWAVKTEKGKSVVPVIKLYWTGTDIETRKDFKVWEDDFLVEPFEVMELFALCEAELKRFPQDRRIVQHLTHFEFRTRKDNLARAGELMASLLAKSGLGPERSAPFAAAVAEALENAARHAHAYDPGKCIDVVFFLDREKATVTITDEGPGFDHASHLARARHEQPIAPERLRQGRGSLGKLGIPLMLRSADELEYLGNGNAVRLAKRLR